MFIPYLNFKIN